MNWFKQADKRVSFETTERHLQASLLTMTFLLTASTYPGNH